MARSISNARKITDRKRQVEFESIDDELKRDRQTKKAAGQTRMFTRGVPRRAR